MNRLNLYDISIEDNFRAVKYKLHERKRKFMEDYEAAIKESWNNYKAKMHTNPCDLQVLNPLWVDQIHDEDGEINRKKECRDLSEGLYGNDRPFVDEHIVKLTAANGGCEIVCPICGVELWDEIDHHIPKALFPEYSGLCYNLIPLCHDCNHEKSDLWLDDNGNRLIFNAYIDEANDGYLESRLSIVDGFPKITIYQKNDITPIIQSTLCELKLIKRYQREAEKVLRTETHKLERLFSQRKHATMTLWSLRKSEYSDYSVDTAFSIVERLVYKEIGSSDLFESWLKSKMNIK